MSAVILITTPPHSKSNKLDAALSPCRVKGITMGVNVPITRLPLTPHRTCADIHICGTSPFWCVGVCQCFSPPYEWFTRAVLSWTVSYDVISPVCVSMFHSFWLASCCCARILLTLKNKFHRSYYRKYQEHAAPPSKGCIPLIDCHATCNMQHYEQKDSVERAESRDKPVLERDKTEKMDSRRHDL